MRTTVWRYGTTGGIHQNKDGIEPPRSEGDLNGISQLRIDVFARQTCGAATGEWWRRNIRCLIALWSEGHRNSIRVMGALREKHSGVATISSLGRLTSGMVHSFDLYQIPQLQIKTTSLSLLAILDLVWTGCRWNLGHPIMVSGHLCILTKTGSGYDRINCPRVTMWGWLTISAKRHRLEIKLQPVSFRWTM